MVDDGVGLFHRRRLFDGNRRGAHERVDLLQQMALVFHEVRAAQTRTLGEHLADAADLVLDGTAARLGGMGGEHGMQLELVEQLAGTVDTDFVDEPAEGHSKLVGGVDIRLDGHQALAVVERLDTIVLLAQVCQVEERRERADEHLHLVDGQAVDELDGITKGTVALVSHQRDALLVGLLGRGGAARVAPRWP